MKTTTKAQLTFVPAICQDGGDENKRETFTDTQRTSPGGVVEAHHREGSECGQGFLPALTNNEGVFVGHLPATEVVGLDQATPHRWPLVPSCEGVPSGYSKAPPDTASHHFIDAALIDGSGTDQGPLGTSVESKPMKKYRRRMAKLLGDALDRGDNVLVRRGIKRLLKVVERAKH